MKKINLRPTVGSIHKVFNIIVTTILIMCIIILYSCCAE